MSAPNLGIFLPTAGAPGDEPLDVAAAARHAEDLGYESVWAVDQLVAGTGNPMLDSGIALAVAAGATERIRLAYGVMVLPLRPVVWAAKQVATLQEVSGGRVIFGVGAGGDRHDQAWIAAGVDKRRRGRLTDDALRVLPDLIAGKAVALDDGATVSLAPGVPVPPIVVGGTSDAALRRTIAFGDGWFLMPVPPDEAAADRDRLVAAADAAGVPAPEITGSLLTVVDGDPSVPGPDAVRRRLTDPDGMFGMPDEAADHLLFRGGPAAVAERLAAYGEAGASRVVVSVAAGDWFRQAELIARSSLGA